MFFHALWNFIFAILLPIFYYQFATPYAENTDAYEISITEKPFFVSDESQYLKIDSLNQEIKSIELKQISLQNLLDTLYQKDQYYVHDVLINLDFRSNEHASKDEFLKILMKEYEIKWNPLHVNFSHQLKLDIGNAIKTIVPADWNPGIWNTWLTQDFFILAFLAI